MTSVSDPRKDSSSVTSRQSAIPKPVRAHDDFTLDQLAASYNFRKVSNFHALFTRLIVKELLSIRERLDGEPLRALNVGCGIGIGRNTALLLAVHDHIDEHWGVEPDESVKGLPIFKHFQHATIEDAELPQRFFDLVYSGMVVEHVANPDAFMRSIARCLKPGGVHLFMTVNGSHYFGRMSRSLQRLGLEDVVLRVIKGKQAVAGYHYPVQYRMNTQSQIELLSRAHGFDQVTSAFVEDRGPVGYLPGPLRPVLWVMNAKRRIIHDPGSLLTLICRMRKSRD